MQKLFRLIAGIFKNVRMALLVLVLAIGVIVAIGFAVAQSGASIPVLEPRGLIAREQKNLLLISVGLMMLVVVPVFVLLFVISWKYRASNTKATYKPDWDHNSKLELLWWGVPCAIILVLASLTWITSHSLDPFKPIASEKQPLKIQVIALQWKWLFIYPDEKVGSINEVAMPVDRPVVFEITSDAPMNSFWIPSLAGQIYAMSGMSTKLHVVGDTVGDYRGSSANISGEGFSNMRFTAKVMTNEDYRSWVKNAYASENRLTRDEYNSIAAPSWDNPVVKYVVSDLNLYDSVIQKYHNHFVPEQTDYSTFGDSMGHDHSSMEDMYAR